MQQGIHNEHSQDMTDQPCSEWQLLLVLLAGGEEIDPPEQARLSAHLAQCVICSEALDREKELLALLAAHQIEPDAALLASCRAGLEDALDREEERGWWRRYFGALLPSTRFSPRPAWSAALLLMLGFTFGILGPRLLRDPLPAPPSPAVPSLIRSDRNSADASESINSPLSAFDLHTADVAGINVFPSGGNEPPQVELQMKTQRPVTVQGTVDNGDVKSVLLRILRNNQRFDPDVRLSAVDLLRARSNDSEVRSVLCDAVRTDRNAAVRLKALEALNGAEPQDIIRETLLDALVDDRNPGVRIEAINALRDMAAKGQVASDDRMLAILRDRMRKDPNTYIRLQSAAAIQDLNPRQNF
jgi:HEAT repeats